MAPVAIYLASDEATHVNGKRFVAIEWNGELGRKLLEVPWPRKIQRNKL